MNKIDIKIERAEIESFTVWLIDGKIEISTTIKLLTLQNKKIATYSIATNAWDNDNHFTLSPEMEFPVKHIAEQLEKIVTEHCSNSILKIENKNES